jgi:dihydrodipicolinate synthase/N-acetylneuraminate lyase
VVRIQDSGARSRLVARVKGVFTPVVTPFRPDGSVDTNAFEANLDLYAQFDLAGALVLGSNGEAGSLDEGEKLALVGIARARLDQRVLLVGTGLESTRATSALCRKVADLGADAALVLTPHYYKARMTCEALARHFEAVADASPIPILLYSVPAFTGITWPAGLAETLAEHPNIAGIKESSGDIGLLGRLRAGTPESFVVGCGSAPVFYPALCVGASAGVLAAACCAPRTVAALYRAHESGDHSRARSLQKAIMPLAVAVTAGHGVAGLKAAMDAAGFHGGTVRAPLLPVDEAARRDLVDLVARAATAL